MDKLNKTIKQLSPERYKYILEQISGGRRNKPYLVLVNAREKNLDDDEMREILGVNASTYYTLKSRLNQKVASLLARDIDNPISTLLEEVKRVPALLYGTNKTVTITVIKDLEKRLKEYDLSNELIVVYKALVRLYRYSEEYENYEKLYKKHVAFSLAVSKAEDLFYEFIKRLGFYLMSYDVSDLESVRASRRELSNISDLYESHRLFVFYHIVRTYYLCSAPHKRAELRDKESDIEQVLDKIDHIFDRFNLDVFYQNFKVIIDLQHFEYYTHIDNYSKADHYYNKVNYNIPELAQKHIMAFYIVQFLNSKILKYLKDNNISIITDINDRLVQNFDVDPDETYHYMCFRRYLAVAKFYQGDYAGAARLINEMRNEISLKQYQYIDTECKLFQALQYCILGRNELCANIINNVKRQVKDSDEAFREKVNLFVKLLKMAMKTADLRQKTKKMAAIWNSFQDLNDSSYPVFLWYVKLDERLLRIMANPIKN
jgi:hypothetical protein